MSLAVYGAMLIVLWVYGFVDALGSLLAGGREVNLGWALGYSVVMTVACVWMYGYERRTNRAARSQFLHLDAQAWLMSALASAALVVALSIARVLGSTRYAHLMPSSTRRCWPC